MPPPDHLALTIYLAFAAISIACVVWIWAAVVALREEPEDSQGLWFLAVLFGWLPGALVYLAVRWRRKITGDRSRGGRAEPAPMAPDPRSGSPGAAVGSAVADACGGAAPEARSWGAEAPQKAPPGAARRSASAELPP
ncbi:MAG: hypothetical protein L6R48_07825 [Planctomycetes bacterium]|nr:hypothetical protein [Planctomycetota bacterium]